jgi:thiol-disulfide isomerase/thioredoxin
MKNYFLGLLACLLLSNGHAQISFEQGTWKEVLAKARQEDKPVFVDVYTTWCGPCRWMDQNTFLDSAVSRKYNSEFICYKLDAEKGEGIEVAKNYNVGSYPTYLFVNQDGILFFRNGSSQPAEKFLQVADQALAARKEAKKIADLDRQYTEKQQDTAFLYTYLLERNRLKLASPAILDQYLSLLPEKQHSSPKTLRLLVSSSFEWDSKAYEILLKHREKTQSLFSADSSWYVSLPLWMSIKKIKNQAISNNDSLLFDKFMHKVEQLNNTQTDSVREVLRISHHLDFYRLNNQAAYIALTKKAARIRMKATTEDLARIGKEGADKFAEPYLKGEKDSLKVEPSLYLIYEDIRLGYLRTFSSNLTAYANDLYDLKVSEADTKEAVTWCERAEKHKTFPELLNVHALLLYRLGRKSEALSKQEAAIALFKKYNMEFEDYELQLQEMKKGTFPQK